MKFKLTRTIVLEKTIEAEDEDDARCAAEEGNWGLLHQLPNGTECVDCWHDIEEVK